MVHYTTKLTIIAAEDTLKKQYFEKDDEVFQEMETRYTAELIVKAREIGLLHE